MKDLLIVSTFGSVATEEWYATQRHFIAKNTDNYDYAVYLHDLHSHVDEESFDCPILGRASGELLYALPQMFEDIYAHFRQVPYRNYLLLDSDCFPVKPDWVDNLLSLMGDKWYAAPVRTENLDIFPHPCALFIKGQYIQESLFTFRRKVAFLNNLRGEKVYDIGSAFKTEVDEEHILFPLIRSNFINPHPVLAAIYGDTFYHHGAGSRTPFFRSSDYWENVCPNHELAGQKCFNWFHKNPEQFVAKLRGEGIVDSRKSLREFFNF